MSAVNGHDPLAQAIEQAKQQQAAQQMLQQVLNQALNQPARVTQITGPCLVTVAKNPGGGSILLVAQVTGERWDVPLDEATARRIAFALASTGEPAGDQAADEALAE